MRHFVQIIANGQIVSSGNLLDTESITQITRPNTVGTLVEVPAYLIDPNSAYWDGLAVIPKPAQPSPNHVFDYPTKTWIDPRTLTDFKGLKWADVKAARDAAIDAPLATPYGTFDCDANSRSNITNSVLMLQTLQAAGTPTTIEFTLANNSSVVLTTAHMVTVGLLLGAKVQAAYSMARTLREQIDLAANFAAVAAIAWPA